MNFLRNLVVRGEDDDEGNNDAPPDTASSSSSAEVTLTPQQIRERRLARLSATAKPKEVEGEEPSPSPKQNPTPLPVAAAAPTPAEQVKPPAVQKNDEPKKGENVKGPMEGVELQFEKSKRTKLDPVNAALSTVFQFSITKVPGKYVHLVGFETELKQQGKPVSELCLHKGNLEEALYCRLEMLPIDMPEFARKETPSEYLLSCFERLHRLRQKGKANDESVGEALNLAQQFIVSYSTTVFLEPSMFPTTRPATTPVKTVLEAIKGSAALTVSRSDAARHLLKYLAEESVKQECVDSVVEPMFKTLTHEMREASKTSSPFQVGPVVALAAITAQKPFGACLAAKISGEEAALGGAGWLDTVVVQGQSPQQPPPGMDPSNPLYTMMMQMMRNQGENITKGRRVERESMLGAFLQPDICAPKVLQEFFSNVLTTPRPQIKSTMQLLQQQSQGLVNELSRAVLNVCRSGATGRTHMMDWVSNALCLNAARSQMQPSRLEVSGDGFAVNLASVMLQLCRPFLSAGSDKVKLIDTLFFSTPGKYVSKAYPHDLTRLGTQSDGGTTPNIGFPKLEKDFNFVSRCFFYAIRAVHLGPVACIRRIGSLERHLSHLQRTLGPGVLSPMAGPSRERAAFASRLQLLFATQCISFEPEMINDCILLYALYSKWVLLVASSAGEVDFNRELDAIPVPLPCTPQPNPLVINTPEHILDDMTSLLKALAYHAPERLDGAHPGSLGTILLGLVVFLASPEYVNSPHLRANFGETLFAVFLPDSEKGPERLSGGETSHQKIRAGMFENSALVCQRLAPGLLELYGDVEATGYYEAIGYRQHIALLLKYIWKLSSHRAAFHHFARSTPERFVKFANGIMNQTNDGIAESLKRLREIRQTQQDRKNVSIWMNMSEDDQRQRLETLEENERFVSTSLLLAGEVISMIRYLALDEVFVEAFMVPSLINRLAGMLSSILISLSGPKGMELKIDNPEKYNFRPKELLSSVFETVARFFSGGQREFVRAVAACAYYEEKAFDNASKTVRKFGLLDEQVLRDFDELNSQCKEQAAENRKEEEQLGEAPEEFLDPLMLELMSDPVLLPTSGNIVDRSFIEQHLLNDASDPFNRQPLTIDMVKPQTDLKNRIEQWIASKKK